MATPVFDAERTFVGVREVRRDFPLPAEAAEFLEVALNELAPQALLRDLHRPELSFNVSIMDFDRHEIPRDAGRQAYDWAKGIVLADYRVPIESLLRTNREAHEAMRDLKGILARPWSKAPKLGTQRIPASLF